MFRNQPSVLVNETDKLGLNRLPAAGGSPSGFCQLDDGMPIKYQNGIVFLCF